MDMTVFHPTQSRWCTIQINIGHLGSHEHSHDCPCYSLTNADWSTIPAIYSLDHSLFRALKHSKWELLICATCMTKNTPDSNHYCLYCWMEILWHSQIQIFAVHCWDENWAIHVPIKNLLWLSIALVWSARGQIPIIMELHNVLLWSFIVEF